MFLRIDTDLFINVNNILGYKLFDEGEAYKLIIWCGDGKISHTVFYMKSQPSQIGLLQEVVNNFRELTINPDISMYREVANLPSDSGVVVQEEPPRRVKETIPGQMTIDEFIEDPIIDEGEEII